MGQQEPRTANSMCLIKDLNDMKSIGHNSLYEVASSKVYMIEL